MDKLKGLTIRLLMAMILVFPLGVSAQRELLREINELEYFRKGTKRLVGILRAADVHVQQRALRALGRIQDPDTITAISESLHSKNAMVRREAAFALGQMWDQRAEKFLLNALERETVALVRTAIIEALGKVGSAAAVQKLLEEMDNAPFAEEAAYALGILGYRGVCPAETAEKLAKYLRDENVQVREAVSFALMRIGDPSVREALAKALADKSAFVRMNAARALANCTPLSEEAASALIEAVSDPDPRVVVNAINALQKLQVQQAVEKILPLATRSDSPVQITAIRALGGLHAKATSRHLRQLLQHKDPLVAGEAIVALAQIEGEAIIAEIEKRLDNREFLLQIRLARALGHIPGEKSFALLESMTNTEDYRVLAAVIEAMAKNANPNSYQHMLKALATQDIAVITAVAQGFTAQQQKQAVKPLLKTYRKLKAPIDIEPMDAIIRAIAVLGSKENGDFLREIIAGDNRILALAAAKAVQKLTGEDLHAQICKNSKIDGNFDATVLEIGESQVVITTNKGKITLQMFAQDAPVTVANFLRLARRDFYNGLIFHRVVSNFVVQGGDPRGDGWGGPGYTIPCEYNFHRYTRGMVGMPLAGKDTGGCQFFITHSPQPHLNGRYTIFAQVVAGMETVDRLREGDRIEKVEVLRR